MTKEVQYNLKEFSNGAIDRNAPRYVKEQYIEGYLNKSKYEFLGFDKNGSVIRLMPRFHNKRDRKGRFVCKRK